MTATRRCRRLNQIRKDKQAFSPVPAPRGAWGTALRRKGVVIHSSCLSRVRDRSDSLCWAPSLGQRTAHISPIPTSLTPCTPQAS